jgi:peptide/nickel transport system substrate-binding protein
VLGVNTNTVLRALRLLRGAELSANDRYRRGRPQIRRISIKFFANENSMALALRAGEIDVAPQVTGAAAFAATSGARLTSVPSCQHVFFSMNTKVAPWNDVHVRRAAGYALNRTDLVRA